MNKKYASLISVHIKKHMLTQTRNSRQASYVDRKWKELAMHFLIIGNLDKQET